MAAAAAAWLSSEDAAAKHHFTTPITFKYFYSFCSITYMIMIISLQTDILWCAMGEVCPTFEKHILV